MVKQTAGRDALGTFAPQFAALNDDVLFRRSLVERGTASVEVAFYRNNYFLD